MKTLKKVLAVVLALAMVLGMTSMASAAFEGETINADYKEAVDVMNAIGILVGDANSKFNPTNTLTRADACKIITYMLGQGNYAGKGAFSDCNGHWAESYIGFCAAQGIVDGIGGGKFNPNGQLTGYAFAKMVAVALGYNAKLEGMTGSTWEAGVAKVVKEADLTDGIDTFAGSKAISREEAAQVAFNALFTKMVVYNTTINSDGVITYSKSSTTNYATQQGKTLAAENFAKLTKIDEQDTVNGQASHTWYYKGTKIGTYSDAEKAFVTYSGINMKTAALEKQIKADLAAYTDADAYVYINNDYEIVSPLKSKDAAVARILSEVNNGRTVAVYGSLADKTITKVVVIDEVVGVVKKVTTKSVTVEVSANHFTTAEKIIKAPTADSSEAYKTFYESVHALKKNDVFTFTIDNTGTSNEDMCGTFLGLAEKVAAVKCTATDAKTYGGASTIYTIGGEKYQVSCNANNGPAVGTTYNLYLDTNGYIVYVKEVDNTVAYVAQTYDTNEKRADRKYYAYVLYNDGTVDDIEIQSSETNKLGYKTLTNSSKGYTFNSLAIDGSEGVVYDVNAGQTFKASYAKEVKLNAFGASSAPATAYMNEDTVVFVYDSDADEYVAYTYDAIPTVYLDGEAVALVKSNRIVSMVIGKDAYLAADNEITNVYLVAATGNIVDVDDDTFYEWNAVVDGEADKVFVYEDYENAGAYAVKATNADGYITALEKAKHISSDDIKKFSGDDAGIYTITAKYIKLDDYTFKFTKMGSSANTALDTVASEFECFVSDEETPAAAEIIDIDGVEVKYDDMQTVSVAVNAQGEIAWVFVAPYQN